MGQKAQKKSLKAGLSSRLLFYLPLVIGLVFILIMILHFAVNTPSEDQWEMVPLFQKAAQHTLGIADLWKQHNEHRIFFPLLLALANAYLTHWNTIVEMLIGFVFAVISATLIFLMLKSSIKDRFLGLTAGTMIAAWFFSPIQWGNWLWGWQLEWFMCVFGAIATLYILLKFVDSRNSKNRKILFALAVACAVVGTYSLASGLFAWAVGLFILIAKRQSRRVTLTWTTLGILSIALYYYHYTPVPTPGGSSSHFFIHHIFRFAQFFVAFLGGIVGSIKGDLQAPDIIGSILLVCLVPLLYITWERRKNLKVYLPWLAIILFAVLCGLTTAYGRLGYGVNFALNSRYSAFSLLYIVGLTGLAFTLLVNTKSFTNNVKLTCAASIALLSIPLYISSYAAGFHGFKSQSNYLQAIHTCTSMQNPTDACLSKTYPSPQVVRPRLEYLKTKHWAGY